MKDRIIQIVAQDKDILGLSESGVLYYKDYDHVSGKDTWVALLPSPERAENESSD